jgi:hypothetical protein
MMEMKKKTCSKVWLKFKFVLQSACKKLWLMQELALGVQ